MNDSTDEFISTHDQTTVYDGSYPPKKPLSAYFHYANYLRPILIQQYKSDQNKIDISTIGKQIGKQWNELTDADKQIYIDQHEHDKQRYELQLQQYNIFHGIDNAGSINQDKSVVNKELELILPTHKVKKVVLMDNEIKSIGKESLLLITKLTELFLHQLITRICTVCETSNRRTVRNIDYAVVLRREPQYQWLNLSLQTIPAAIPTNHMNDDNNDESPSDHEDDNHDNTTGDTVNTNDNTTTEHNETTDTTENKDNNTDQLTSKPKKSNKQLSHITDLTTLLQSDESFVTIQPKHKSMHHQHNKRKKSIGGDNNDQTKNTTKKLRPSNNQLNGTLPSNNINTNHNSNQSIHTFFKSRSNEDVVVGVDDD